MFGVIEEATHTDTRVFRCPREALFGKIQQECGQDGKWRGKKLRPETSLWGTLEESMMDWLPSRWNAVAEKFQLLPREKFSWIPGSCTCIFWFSESAGMCIFWKKFSKSFCKNRHDGREQLDLILCSCDGSQVTEACPAPASAGEMIWLLGVCLIRRDL